MFFEYEYKFFSKKMPMLKYLRLFKDSIQRFSELKSRVPCQHGN